MRRGGHWRRLVLAVLWDYYGELLLSALTSAGLFAVLAVGTLLQMRKIEREGQETDAVVSRVEAQDPSGDSRVTYVRYRDERGETWESPMSVTSGAPWRTGERLRIKYLPGCRELVRPAAG